VLGVLDENDEAVSGDYVASTNRLHSWVSECICDRLMCHILANEDPMSKFPVNFHATLKSFMLKALTKHIFVDESGIRKNQTEGQLMGSIVSFPVLCLANAALCRYSLEEATLSHSLTKKVFHVNNHGEHPAPLLINGDDCLLRGRVGYLRPIWEGICKTAGLESSIGKTYFSRQFCTINSTIFVWSPDDSSWVEAKYINLGLMKGLKRIGAGKKKVSSQVGIHQLGTIARELKRTCPENLWPVVKSRFIYYNSIELNRYPGLPWFVPEWLGGVGLPLDKKDEVTPLDRCAATAIKFKFNDPKWTPILPKDAAMWLMHQRVMKDLPQKEVAHYYNVDNHGDIQSLEDNWSGLYKAMTINLLMKDPLESLYDELDDNKSVHRAIRRNADIWSKARAVKCQPMSDEDMMYEQKALYVPCKVVSGDHPFDLYCFREDWDESA